MYGPREPELRAKAMRNTCPVCKAKPGASCTSPKGKVHFGYHLPRYEEKK